MTGTLLSILLAFLGYTLMNLGQAAQKIGMDEVGSHRVKGWAIWSLGTIGTFVSVLVVLFALDLGKASTVAPMAGTGLMSLALFSRLVMKEPISRVELAGVGTIVCSAALIGAFTADGPQRDFRWWIAGAFGGAVAALYGVLILAMRRKRSLRGLAFAAAAGGAAGLSTLTQKLSTTSMGISASFLRGGILEEIGDKIPILRKILQFLANPFAPVWIGFTMAAFALIHLSYRKGKAVAIVPVFTSNLIIIPVLGGVAVLGESLHPLQWLGSALVVVGVLLLAGRNKVASGSG
jgi:uncharacterized membrane protein